MFVGVLSQSLIPSFYEETALNLVNLMQIKNRELERAAKLIQFTWREHRRLKSISVSDTIDPCSKKNEEDHGVLL